VKKNFEFWIACPRKGMDLGLLKRAISIFIVGCGVLLGLGPGCAPGSNPFGTGGKWRVFDSKPAPASSAPPARTAKAPERRVAPRNPRAAAHPSTDPQARQAEQQVNDQVERMKQALAGSAKTDPVVNKSRRTARTGDSDSLAAKLAQAPDTPGSRLPSRAEYSRTTKAPDRKQVNTQRPTITPVKRTREVRKAAPVSESPQPQAQTKSQPKPKSEGIRITAVEPVEAVTPTPAPTAEPVVVKKAPVILPAAPANTAARVDVPDPQNTNASLDMLLFRLEQKIKDRPEDTATQVKLRLVYAMLGQWQQALKEKAGKDTTGGEFGKNLAALVKIFDSADVAPGQQANQALKIVERMQEWLRDQADLSISTLKLCREVGSYGCFKEMPSGYFVAGRSLPVIVYIELENFRSKYLRDKQNYQTLLSMSIEVLNASGKVCWHQHYEQIEDLANKQRRDFYLAPQITLPAGLPEGKLKMKVMVEDLNGNKVAQRMLDLEIKSQ
jgi:hypothetical protein